MGKVLVGTWALLPAQQGSFHRQGSHHVTHSQQCEVFEGGEEGSPRHGEQNAVRRRTGGRQEEGGY